MSKGRKNQSKDTGDGSLEVQESSQRESTNEGRERGGLAGLFNFGSQNSPFEANDASDAYAQRGYYLRFTHIPSGKQTSFKAFITNFQDSYASNWTPQTAYGRMDQIYTFQNTTRQLSVSFSIPAFDEEDARCNLTKCTNLARQLYPYYSNGAGNNASTIAKAPLMRVRFANLIRDGRFSGDSRGLLGKINGFTFTPNIDHGFYDLQNFLYPKTMEVTFTFDVLHEHIMGWTDNAPGPDISKTSTGISWSEGKAGFFPYARSYTQQTTSTDTTSDADAIDADADDVAAAAGLTFEDQEAALDEIID